MKIFCGIRSTLYKRFEFLLPAKALFQDKATPEFYKEAETATLAILGKAVSELNVISDEWKSILSTKKSCFALSSYFEQKDLHTAALQRLIDLIRTQYYFCKLVLTVSKAPDKKFSIAAPSEIRKTFKKHGIPVDDFWSSVSWFFKCLEIFSQAFVENMKGFAKIKRDFLLLNFRKITDEKTPGVFWLGVPPEAAVGSDPKNLSIIDFIGEKKFSFLSSESPTFIVSNTQNQNQFYPSANAYIGRDPYLCPARKPVTTTQFIQQIFLQSVSILKLISNFIFARWWNLVLAIDSAELPRAKIWFESVKPTSILQAFSAAAEPLWILFGKHYGVSNTLVFYSATLLPIENKGESFLSFEPGLRSMIADRFVVWGEENKKWLLKWGYSEDQISVVGPIIYAKYPEDLGKKREPLRSKEVITIGVYDIGPPNIEFLVRMIGIGKSYYSLNNVLSFIDDTNRACKEAFKDRKYRVIFKPKRGQVWFHEPKYWQAIEKLSSEKEFVALNPGRNPLLLTQELDVIICIPFSSPALIGQHYGVPSCFYDPTARVQSPFLTHLQPELVGGYDSLVSWLKGLI